MNKFASIFIGAVTGATLISTSAQAAPAETKKDPCYRYEQYPLRVIEDTCSDNKIEHQPYTS